MDKLPSEILNKIFIQLDLQQRLKCLLVCRNWWSVLDKYSLFYDIHIDESENIHQFDRFMEMFERLPDRAAQVEELDIGFLLETSFDKRSILNIFPNARVVKTNPSLPVSSLRDDSQFKTPIDPKHSNSKIEFLSDHSNCELTCHISTSNLGGRLEVLYLNLYRVPDVHKIFSQLKGLSVLKKLSLKFAQIRLWCLEELHRNIPSIEDFALDNLRVMGGSMPSNIVPATCIAKFKLGIEATRGSKLHKEFYQYMTEKYINITDIEYIDAALSFHSADKRKSIYLDGILDFYKLIGPNIDELNLERVPDGVDPFEALDAVGSKIKKFDLDIREGGTIYDYLCQSNQSKYIEHLGLCLPNFCSPDIIKRIPSLTELSLTLSHHHSFVDYLDACPPSLKHLTLKSQYLTRTPLPSHVYSIETLVIESKILNSSIGNVITYCLPNLVKLTLKGELRESLNIKLTHPALQKATFYLKSTAWSRCSDLGFLYKSPNHTELKYWLNGTETTTPVNDEDIKGIPVLSVVSLTEKRLCFNDGFFEINILSC
jgi:hypothetical protein